MRIFKKKRSRVDRRCGLDRRTHHALAQKYFANSSTDPRSGKERRTSVERRSGWKKINIWSSVEIG